MNNFQKYCAFYNHIRSGAGAEGGGGGRVDACPRPIENKKNSFYFGDLFPSLMGVFFSMCRASVLSLEGLVSPLGDHFLHVAGGLFTPYVDNFF